MPQFLLDLLALPPEASTSSVGIDALHAFVIAVTMVASFAVFAAAFYFVVRYRRRDDDALTRTVRASAASEVAIVGGVLSLFLLWWVIGYRQFVALRSPPDDALTIYVTAKQWMWKFSYPDGRGSNDVLTVPLGRPVKLIMTSRDVIHSFYVPAFRDKQDVLPRRFTTLWFEAKVAGNYPIYCAEYCGLSHSMMRGTVSVLGPDDYARWLRTPTNDASGETDLVTYGAAVAARRECLACHTTNGQKHVGPTWARLYGSRVAMNDGRLVLADEEYLTRSMMEPNADVVAGFHTLMPSYFGILPQPEVAALVEYIKSLRDAEVPSGVALPTLDVSGSSDVGAGIPLLPRLP